MKPLRTLLRGLILLSSLLLTSQVSAQITDTLLVDYKSSTYCTICGDPDYSCYGTDSLKFTDSTTTSLRLIEIKFLFLHTACTSYPTTLMLNGDTMGSWNNSYSCLCSTCRRDSIVISGSKLTAYKQGGANTFIYSGGSNLCIARYMIIRKWGTTTDYDMATSKLKKPLYQCAGSNDIEVQVTNYGSKQVDSVELHWIYNGTTQSTVKDTGTIDTIGGSGSFTKNIKLGSKTLVDGQVDTLIAWTEKPNGVTDTLRFNDTLTVLIAPAYKDTLTVGGSSPDFATLEDAYAALVKFGICGPVVLNMRTGSYNEQLSFGNVVGADSTNTITIQSESGDSTDVRIYFSSTSSENFVVRLDGAAFVTFKGVTLEATNSTYGRIVEAINSSNHIRFEHCRFIGSTSSSSSTSRAIFYSSTNQSINHLQFTNCFFNRGSYAIYISNYYNNLGKNYRIEGCLFQDQYYDVLYLNYVNGVDILRNTISKNSSMSSGSRGMYFSYCQGTIAIERNSLINQNGGYGIYMYYKSGNSSNQVNIQNNFISISSMSSGTCMPLYIYGSSYINVYHNNLYTSTGYSGNSAIYTDEGSNLRFSGNSVYCALSSMVWYNEFSSSVNVVHSNHNNLFTKGGSFGYWNSSVKNFALWKTTSQQDSNSVSTDPKYVSSTDLHVSGVDLNGTADSSIGITHDFDNEARDSIRPDIGADEFKLPPNDAALIELRKFRSDTSCVEVVLRNVGDDTLKSVTVAWVFDGTAQTSYSWTGTLLSGDTAVICLGTKVFKRDSAHNIKVWSSMPNGVTDTINENDTITKRVFPALSGIYTIGGTSPDYASFTAAISALDSAGIIDSAVFRVRDGTYNEQLHLTKIEGADGKNQVIFESESKDSSKVILQTNSANYYLNYLVWLDGADGITFRGMHMRNNTSSYQRVVYISNGSDYAQFSNNIIQNDDTTGSSAYYGTLVYGESTADHNFCLLNNLLVGGAYGYFSTGSSSQTDDSTMIKGNVFINQGYTAIYAQYFKSLSVVSNRIAGSMSPNYYTGIYLYYGLGACRVEKNRVEAPNTGETYGIYMSSFGFGDTTWVMNNFVSIGGTQTGRSGIRLNSFTRGMILHNSIHQYGTDTATSQAIYFGSGSYTCMNNNFVCSEGGIPFYVYYSTVTSDYNNFITPTSQLSYISGTIYNSLAAHIAGTSNDSNSVQIDPQFQSKTDLHVVNPKFNKTAMSYAFVQDDIDGQTRDTVPDIGADEIFPQPLDIGIRAFVSPSEVFSADTQNIIVVVANFGLDTIFNGTIRSRMNSDTLADYAFSDTVLSGDTIHVQIGRYAFRGDTLNNFMAWTAMPNSSTDQKHSNDTFKVSDRLTAMSGEYTIGGTSPDFNNFKEAVDALIQRGVLDSAKFKVRNGTYNEQVCIPEIKGAGGRNSIIFESASKDSTDVQLVYASSKSDSNYTVYLNGADGITFRHMTLEGNGTNYASAVNFDNGANQLTIENCIVKGVAVTSNSFNYTVIRSGNTTDNGFMLRNSHIQNGGTAVRLEGPYQYSTREVGAVLQGNQFTGFYASAIFVIYNKGVQILDNYIHRSTTSYNQLVYLQTCTDTFMVSGNELILDNYGDGIYCYEPGYNSSDSNLITNNSVTIKNVITSSFGIGLSYPQGVYVAHNSVRLEGSYQSSYCFGSTGYGSKVFVLNNILENQAKGYAYHISNLSVINSCNYNNIRTNGPNIGYTSNVLSDLSAWSASTGLDSNSTQILPMFVSADDLQITNVDLDKIVMRLPYVLYDQDGDARDSLTEPGAFDITLKNLDAGIQQILVPSQPFRPDTQQVAVLLKNFGETNLTSVKIHWVLNGDTGTVYNWSDTLVSKATDTVYLGQKYFDLDSSYSMVAWTSDPNNGTDQLTSNDTAETIDQYPALSGHYTIGGASPDFVDFTAAVTAMKRGGIVDSVVFDVRNGTYTEQITIPRILGANHRNSIVFQSTGMSNTNNVVLSFTSNSSSNNWVVSLDSAYGVTFKRITMNNKGTYYCRIVEMDNNSDYNEFNGCVFTGDSSYNSTVSTRNLFHATCSNGHNNDYNKIIGCQFTGGAMGVYIYGYSSGQRDRTWVVRGNKMINNYYRGLYLAYTDTVVVDGNYISQNGYYSSSSAIGLYMTYINGAWRVTSNTVKGKFSRSLYIQSCDGSSSEDAVIANNMLHSSWPAAHVMYLEYCDYVQIVHNSLHASSANGNRVLYTYSGSNLDLLNNILAESGSGYAWFHTGSSSAFSKIDHNDYVSNGSILAYFNYSSRTDFAALKSATGQDTGSVSVDPGFIADDDLHAREITLNEAGTPINGITTDIDGDTRDTLSPDIGADEFEPPAPEDAGVSAYLGPKAPFASGSKNVEIVLKNFGSDTLTSATVNWTANGTSQTSYSWTGSLLPGEIDTVNLGAYNFQKVQAYNFVFWSVNPNSVTDTINYNDTTKVEDIYAALDTTYTIGPSGADFPNFRTAVDVLQKAGIIDTVTFNVQSSTYTERFRIGLYEGASKSRPVTFKSISGDSTDVVITNNNSSDSNYLLKIDGADYITFKGLTFKPTNVYYGTCIDVSGGATGIQIVNNAFAGMSSSYYSNSNAILSTTDNDDSCRIENNHFKLGYAAIQWYGLGSSNPEKGTIIRNNTIDSCYGNAIYMYNQEGLVLDQNNINYGSNGNSKTAIRVANGSKGLSVVGNKIVSYGPSDNGIYVDFNGTSTDRGLIANNFVSLKRAYSGGYGIYVYYSDYVTVGFNSVNIYGGTGSSSTSMRVQYGSDVSLLNNILCNRNNGYAVYQVGTGVTNSDRNDLYTTGANLGYYSGDRSNLSAWQSATGKDGNSLSVDPLFTSNDNLHVYISSLDSAATPISGVATDIDGDTRNSTHPDIGADEFNSLLNNIGVSMITKPTNGCDLDSQVIGIRIFNYGSQPQTNYSVWYSVDGAAPVKDTVVTSVGPGSTLNLDFSQKFKFTTYKAYTIKAWTMLPTDQDVTNDTTQVIITNYATPGQVSSMFPLDTVKNVDYPITLSWAPASGSSAYDVYIWDDTASSRPGSPFKSDVSQISTQVTSGLTYGRTYKWQVVSKNNACGTDGPIQKFTMRYLPDLIVESVSGPATGFSGRDLTVSWKVKNIGGGPTGSNGWYDLVYLSTDTILDNADTYLGGTSNASALNPGSNYSQSLTAKLPDGFTGNYYAIVHTDAYRRVLEADDGNNVAVDTSKTVISLTPPPDLIVTSIVRPKVAFSGSDINVSYTVKNDGTGPTRSGQWYDHIYWSADTTFGGGATKLKSIRQVRNLDKDSSYSQGATLRVPDFIQGKHYVYVLTDATNTTYEHTAETNNTSRSDTIGVILSPPPDLIVSDVVAPDTVSNLDAITVKYNTINQGGGSTKQWFYDALYYSTSNIYSASTSTQLASRYSNALAAGDTSKNSVSFYVPDLIVGKYYLYVVTDVGNKVNEHTSEGNNVSKLDSFVIEAPDYTIPYVRTSAKDTTGDTTMVHYAVANQGPGNGPSRSTSDYIYISTLDTFNLDSCTLLGTNWQSGRILANDTMDRMLSVRIPDGYDGRKYFYVVTDASNAVFENGNEQNNTGRSDSVIVTLAPYPDLEPTITLYPDTATAGDTATFRFSIANTGDTTANPSWSDNVYLSKDTVLQPGTDVLLRTILRTSSVLKGGTYTTTFITTIPANTAAGDYYYMVATDAGNTVYEHTGENNNQTQSAKAYINGYPPIDLKMMSVTTADSAFSGTTTQMSWTVKNIGMAKTTAAFWEDCVYISSDSIFDSGDTQLHCDQINTPLEQDSTYVVNASFTVPNGLSGNYYVFVKADKDNSNNDADVSNNVNGRRTSGKLTTMKLILTPPPDLQVSFQSVPSTGTAGQQIHVVWKVVNEGTGPTLNNYWNDHIYLSTDYVIDGTDRRIGSKVHYGNLKKDSSYLDSMDVFIPSDYSGNYILIVYTDAETREYEYNKEGNNTASSIVTVSQAPPADLVVTSVTATDSIISGNQVQITWAITNQGNNPATGRMRDNIYLSTDAKVDAQDKLLGTKNYAISLAKGGSQSSTQQVTISGVPLGDYHVLVQTDVLNNINESIDTNNTGASALMNVDIPELKIGITKKDTLFDDKERMYRIQIHDSVKGESLLVTLRGDSANGNNEIYLRKGQAPSRSEFDYAYTDPFEGNQEIVVPALDTGTYYLLAYGATSSGSYQNIDLLAKILEFEIRKVSPNEGGNTGIVTLKIEGSKFNSKTKFSLSNDLGVINSLIPGDDEDEAQKDYPQYAFDTFLVVNPTLAYVSFRLTGATTGVYDVVGENGGDSSQIFTAKLEDGFTIVKGLPQDIQLNVTRPANARTNRIVTFDVDFTNNGNTDIVGGKLTIISNGTSPISLTLDGLANKATSIQIPLEEDTGLKGRLRPGGQGKVKVYTQAKNALGFSIVLPK